VRDSRKEYNRGRLVRFIVDSEEYSIIDLEKDINSEFKCGSDQQANFWVLTEGSLTCKLVSDAQFLDLLRTSRVVKLLMVVGRREHNVREGGDACSNEHRRRGDACSNEHRRGGDTYCTEHGR
jgi:hypothetical protein